MDGITMTNRNKKQWLLGVPAQPGHGWRVIIGNGRSKTDINKLSLKLRKNLATASPNADFKTAIGRGSYYHNRESVLGWSERKEVVTTVVVVFF